RDTLRGDVREQRAGRRDCCAEAAEGELEDRGTLLGSIPLSLIRGAEPRAGRDSAGRAEVPCAELLHADRLAGGEGEEAAVPVVRRPRRQEAVVEPDESVARERVRP